MVFFQCPSQKRSKCTQRCDNRYQRLPGLELRLRFSLKFSNVCQHLSVLNMAWLSVSLIIYQLETQAAELQFVNSSSDFVHPVELPNFACDQIVYPVVGVVLGLYSSYLIALAMALIGCGIFIITNG